MSPQVTNFFSLLFGQIYLGEKNVLNVCAKLIFERYLLLVSFYM